MAKTSIFELAGAPVATSPEKAKPTDAKPTANAVVTAPKKSSIFELANTYQPPVIAPKISQKDILKDPLKIKTVRDYMVKRKGDYYKNAQEDELMDDFVDHMRWVNTNEVNTVGEARSVFDLSNDAEKKVYADAYNLYDELGSVWGEGIGEFGDAVANYTGAVLTSPSTYLGGFIGKALSKPATNLVKKAVGKKVIEQGIKTAVKETAEAGATTIAKKAAIKTAAKAVEKQVAKKSGLIAAKKSRQELITAAILATGVDSAMAAGQEALRQKTLVDVGAQEEIDKTSVALNTVFGVIGGGFAYFPEAMRGAVKLTDAGGKVRVANALRAKEAKKKIGEEIEASVKQLVTDWEVVAKQGQEKDVSKFLRDKAIDWFFDVDNEKSFIRILQKLGADLGGDDKTFSHKMVEYARGLPPQNRAAITKSLKPLGISFGEMIEVFAGTLKEGGESLSKASQAKRFYDDFRNVAVKKQQAISNTIEGEIEALNAPKVKPPAETVKYAASVWKRLLVSHISTTMLNVKGWGWATTARIMSEILHGGVLGSVGMVQKLMGSSAADKTLAKSSAMFKSNLLLARSLLDPFTSAQGFVDLMDAAPKKFKKTALSAFYGGVGDEGPEMFNINPNSLLVKGTEKTIDAAAQIAFVRTQDIYTKAFTGLKELDKMSRIDLGKGIEELLAKGETHLITDEMWERATKALLEDTFSVDYTKGHSIFNKLAKMTEQVSNAPGIGFIFPFGRFVNNTIGFTFQYSPLAFLPIVKYQRGLDLEERLAKATIGSTALMMVMSREEEKQKQGLQWNEERDSTGEIKDIGGIFPLSLYNLFGRVLVDAKSGNGVPLALFDELVKQVGPLGVLSEVTSSNPITDMVREMTKAAETDDGTELVEIAKMFGEMLLGTASNIAAGYTRPLDPVNDILGVATDMDGFTNDAIVDRKMAQGADKALQNFSRYTSTFFNLLLGEDTGDGKLFGTIKKSATEEKPLKDPNPISRLFGQPVKPRQDSIDILLGMVDLAPYRMDSLTTGVPEYDDFINGTIFPILERKAEAMLDNEIFMSRPAHIKREMVSKMLSEARKEIIDNIEDGSITDADAYAYNERRKFLALPQAYRAEAKKALGIKTEDRDLSPLEVEQLTLWIEINKELDEVLPKEY